MKYFIFLSYIKFYFEETKIIYTKILYKIVFLLRLWLKLEKKLLHILLKLFPEIRPETFRLIHEIFEIFCWNLFVYKDNLKTFCFLGSFFYLQPFFYGFIVFLLIVGTILFESWYSTTSEFHWNVLLISARSGQPLCLSK